MVSELQGEHRPFINIEYISSSLLNERASGGFYHPKSSAM